MKNQILTAALAFGLIANASTMNERVLPSNSDNITVTTIKEISPFCQSISKNDIETVKKLIRMGENVNKFSGGKSPLMYAARYNRVEIIKLLVEKGADIKRTDKRGATALVYAKRAGAVDAESLLREMKKK